MQRFVNGLVLGDQARADFFGIFQPSRMIMGDGTVEIG